MSAAGWSEPAALPMMDPSAFHELVQDIRETGIIGNKNRGIVFDVYSSGVAFRSTFPVLPVERV
jgi:hypothetical protein